MHRRAQALTVLTACLPLALMPAVEHGFPNIAYTLPPPIDGMPRALFIKGPIAPQQGRTAIVAWHGERIVSIPEGPGSQPGADILARVVDIRDPNNPVVDTKEWGTGGFNSHGYFHSGAHLFTGPFGEGGGFYDALVRTGNGVLTPGSMDELGIHHIPFNRSGSQAPWGAEMWWTYGETYGLAWLGVSRTPDESFFNGNDFEDLTGPAVKARWDVIGTTGVIGMPFIIGNILIYAAENSGTGVATYDISDPSNPVLLDVLKDRNPGGYWPEVYGHYIFFPRRSGESGTSARPGFMVVDYSDPTNLRVVAERELAGNNQYVTFQDEYAFMNRYKIDMRTFESVMTIPASDGAVTNDPGAPTNVDATQFALPVGNLVITGGYGAYGPGLGIWAHQAAPDTRPPFVAYHIPRPDQTNYSTQCPLTFSIPETLKSETIVNGSTLIVRPVGGSPIQTWHSFGQGKLLTVTPRVPLASNTTYEVILQNIADAAGNLMEPYTFRFSTGSGLSGGNQPPAISALNAVTSPALPGATITFTVAASDPNGDSLQYRLDYGDGSPKTAWQTGTSFSRAYATADHYTVSVQARDPSGAIASFSRGITVIAPLTGTRPTASTPAVLGASARRLWTVNPDSNTLTAINVDTSAKVWEQPTGTDPRSVALANDGTLWVACHDADRVDVLNGTTGAILTSIPTGYASAPIGICATPDGATMYVACTGDGTLRRLSVSGRAQTGSLVVGPTPRAIAITSTGQRALVTRFISAQHQGEVSDVNLSGSMSLTRTIPLAKHHVTDGTANGRGVPNYLAGITITPDNTRAWVVGKKDNTDRGTLATAAMQLTSDNTVRAQLVVIDLVTNEEDRGLRMDIDNSDSPTAVAFSPRGDYAFIALQGNNQIGIVDHLDFLRGDSPKGLISRLGTGLAPQGLAVDPTTGRLFAANFMGRSVTAIDLNPLLSAGSLNLPGSAIATVAVEGLSAQVLQGKRVFYNAGDVRMSAEGYISCASCHADGGQDGRVWDFTQRGEGLRNTTDLRGRAGMGHGAVHWSGNFDEIQDFEHDIRDAFGGTGFLSNADFAATNTPLGATKAGRSVDLDALAAYVTSLNTSTVPKSPARAADGGNTASATAGRAVFVSENCTSCHTPATGFTDRLLHDVGTLRGSSGNRLGAPLSGIDTPTLFGLHAGAPYFHNGSAATLAEVFTIAGGDLRQAESGSLSSGAAVEDVGFEPMKNWRGGLFVNMSNNGAGVSFTGVAGGAGGPGMVEIRYAASYSAAQIQVVVAGVTTSTTLALTPSDPDWLPNGWGTARVPVTYAGGANTVTIRCTGAGLFMVDEVVFTTPLDHAKAEPHRRVQALSSADRTALFDYLRQIDANDADLTPVPEIAVSRGTLAISDGGNDSAPSGVFAVSQTLIYSIANTGTADLTIGAFTISAVSGCVATVTTPATSPVAGGTATTLMISVTPSASSWSFVLSAVTNDADENPTNWTVTGSATASLEPEIVVNRSATVIPDNGIDSAPMGVFAVAQSLNYTIANTGTADLTVGTFTISAASGCTATVTTPAASLVTSGGITSLVISVTPSAASWTFALSAATNDLDENPANWTVVGNAAASPAPEITVSRGDIMIANGGSDSAPSGVIATPQNLMYSIANTGTAPLTMGSFAVSAVSGCIVAITTPAESPLASGATTTLVVSVTPSAATWSFALAAATNDVDENPCDWTVTGVAAPGDPAPESGSSGSSAPEDSGSCGFGYNIAILVLALGAMLSGRHPGRRARSGAASPVKRPRDSGPA